MMKKYLCKFTLILVCLLSPIMANSEDMEEFSYGVIDQIYLHESRMVINDVSILYTDQSRFENRFGRKLSVNGGEIKRPSYVKYSLVAGEENMVINELKIISKREYNYEGIKRNLDDH